MSKYRGYILLEPEQHRVLSEIADQLQKSVSHVVRKIVQDYLIERDLDERQRQELQAIQAQAKLRRAIQTQRGQITVTDLVDRLPGSAGLPGAPPTGARLG